MLSNGAGVRLGAGRHLSIACSESTSEMRLDVAQNAHGWALVAIVAVFAHAISLLAGFIWLDHAHIEDGLALVRDGDWLGVFTRGFAGTGFYRPLVSLSLSVDALLGGSPALYHGTTLAWHIVAAVMTTVAAEVLGLSRRAAVLAGALFAAHPATSLVAGAIAFRSEAMLTVALLALVVAHVRQRPWGAAVALLAGALTKETALALAPLFIAALELGPRTQGRGSPVRRVPTSLVVAECSAWIGASMLRQAFAPPWRASFASLSWGDALGTRLASLSKSSAMLVLPVNTMACDAFRITSYVSGAALAGALLAGCIGYVAFVRRGPALLFALSVLPSLNFVSIMRWWSPHYLYVPLVFFAMLVAEAADRRGRAMVFAAGALTAVFGLISLRDGARFGTDEQFWRPEVSACPECREGQFYLGEVDRKRQRWTDAAAHYELALAENPGVLSYVDRLAALQNLGVVRLAEGRIDLAAKAFGQAILENPEELQRRRLLHNLATAAFYAGKLEEVSRLLEPESARADAFPESLLLRARALHQLGRDDAARPLVERLRDRPK